jgi:hypothetical protein
MFLRIDEARELGRQYRSRTGMIKTADSILVENLNFLFSRNTMYFFRTLTATPRLFWASLDLSKIKVERSMWIGLKILA